MVFAVIQVIARVVDGSRFDEFKAMYGETLITGNVAFHIQEDKREITGIRKNYK